MLFLCRILFVAGTLPFINVAPVKAQTTPLIFFEGFETTSPSSFLSQYYGSLSSSTRFSIQPEYRATGNFSLKHQFVAGSSVGENVTQHFGDALSGPILPTGRGYHFGDIYVQFKLMFSPGYDWSLTSKIMIAGTQDDQRHELICCNPWVSHYITLYTGTSNNQGYLRVEGNNKKSENAQWFGLEPNHNGYSVQNPFKLIAGKWYTIEFRRSLNTLGQRDGIFQMWVDGEMVAEYLNVEYRVPFDGADYNFGTNFIMLTTYAKAPAPQNQAIYYDDIAVSRTYIGITGNTSLPDPPTNLRIAN